MGERLRGILCGIGAAVLFGMSAPVAKLLVPSAGVFVLAALLYLGAGASLTVVDFAKRRTDRIRDARLRRADLPLLGAITLLGGVVGPVLMLLGLKHVSGVAGALLLNLEAPLTIVLAVTWFREHLGRRAALAISAILAGSFFVAWRPGVVRAELVGALLLGGACVAWAADNNLTQKISARDPIAIVRWKALGAGTCNLVIALALGESLPAPPIVAAALAVGVVSYGLSIVLDTYALRLLGAAREAAFFATAPFIGALAAVLILGDRPSISMVAAAAAMLAGVVLLVTERHTHEHTHEELEHDHLHSHDEHHQHAHEPGQGTTEPHAHPHRHASLTHNHAHLPDAHHRHRH
jgi:drug/metabolite transporter (DMT)-like permease